MPNTYVALRTETVATATPSVTFNLSGISGYTDLKLIITAKDGSASTYGAAFLRFNSDSASNYSFTNIYGDGSTAGSTRSTSATSGDILIAGSTASNFGISTVDIFNYANTTTYKTFISRGNTAESYTNARVGLWRKTPEAINSILITSGNGNFAVGSTFSLYGIANADQGSAKATGGIITEDATYWYHTFGASGAFIPKQSLTCDVLVVAGGGGAAARGNRGAGGGGAGGLLLHSAQSLTATSYNVTVGGGGPGSSASATSGTNSQFASLTASVGGGRGAADTGNGQTGGSGGGGYIGESGYASSASSQGFAGGAGSANVINVTYMAGGGGGAGGAGNAGVNNAGSGGTNGKGGIGSAAYSSWGIATGIGQNVSGIYYLAGGGGGGSGNYGGTDGYTSIGGEGGGGAGTGSTNSSVNGTAGKPNTGGGGGGANYGSGGAGGSGVVIIRYSK